MIFTVKYWADTKKKGGDRGQGFSCMVARYLAIVGSEMKKKKTFEKMPKKLLMQRCFPVLLCQRDYLLRTKRRVATNIHGLHSGMLY